VQKPVIAVINDDPDFLELMQTVLTEELDCEVNVGQQGADALHVIKTQQPDLIILDIMMGYEPLGAKLLEALRDDPDVREIPVIVCSAHGPFLQENAQKLADLDSVILAKPFDLAEALTLVRSKLESL
jgi:CheY-like chemotaxis protein